MIPNFQIHKKTLPENLDNNTIYILLLDNKEYKIVITDILGEPHYYKNDNIEIPNLPNYTITQEDDVVYFLKDGESYFTLDLKKYIDEVNESVDGTSGTDGTSGVDGKNGKDAANGTDGTSGVDGKNGKDGANGTDGTSGVDGENGKDGVNGTDGTSGVDGKDLTNSVSGQVYDTLDDIIKIENPTHGQKVYNLAHNEKGLSNLWGGGEWIFDKEPFFEITHDVNLGRHGRYKMVKTTPFKDHVRIDTMSGQNFMTADGQTFIQFRKTNDRKGGKGLRDRYKLVEEDNNGVRTLAISKGATIANCWMSHIKEEDARSGSDCPKYADKQTVLKAGTKFYPLDDNLEYARPNYEGFDGEGVWRRIFKDRPTPLDAGCIPTNTSHAKDYVDNTKPMQTFLDNWNHNGWIPKGVFICDGELYWRRTKSIKSDGVYFLGGNLQSIRGLGAARSTLSTCGVLATKRNGSFIHKIGGVMYDSNLNIDGSAAKMDNKDLFKVDLNYSTNYMTSNHITCVGNPHYRDLTENGGCNGVHLDATNLEPRGGSKEYRNHYKKTNGSIFFSERNTLSLYNLNYGFRASKPSLPGSEKPTNMNGLEFEIINQIDVKWLYDIERSAGNSKYFRRTGQAAKNVRKNQVHKAWIKLPGRCYFDGYPMDWKRGSAEKRYYYNDLPCSKAEFIDAVPTDWESQIDDVKGTYTFTNEDEDVYKYIEFYVPNKFIEFTGPQSEIGQLAGHEVDRRRGLYKNPAFSQGLYNQGLTNASVVIPNRNRSRNKGMFIESLSNPLLYADLHEHCNTFYIKGFKEDGEEQPNIKVDKPKAVLRHQDGPTKVTFGVGSDRKKDYVEFYIDGHSGRLRNAKWMYITLSGSNFPYKVSTNIDKWGPYDSSDYYGTRTLYMPLSTDATNKYVVRFYGLADPKSENNDDSEIVDGPEDVGSYIIQSISIQNTFGKYMPVLNRGHLKLLRDEIQELRDEINRLKNN